MSEPQSRGRSGSKIANSLVALSSAAVLAVYSAGYLRTRAAAEKLSAAERSRVVIPAAPSPSAPPIAVAQPAASPKPAPPPAPRASSVAPRPKPTETPVASTTPLATLTPTPTVEPIAAPTATPTPTSTPQAALKDGTYSGWGTSRHGDIEATVTITGGRIVSTVISQCLTRYSCSWVEHLPGQVVARQSPDVDYVSRATQSTNAFYYAVVQALAKAK